MLEPGAAVVCDRAHADVAKSVDAADLDANLSARGETRDVEPLKVGESSGPAPVPIPSQARATGKV